ncbi:hypothetical protein DL770_009562 [Monosporascus sp. CRB-9-2]|nr:hypothetical protein DL770_009562 [Monosporascus sp. CRB-9-2]
MLGLSSYSPVSGLRWLMTTRYRAFSSLSSPDEVAEAPSSTTAMLKSASDQSIQSAMMQIADRLPDFSIYQRIYADGDLAVMLAAVYTDVVVFAREATNYLHNHGAQLLDELRRVRNELMEAKGVIQDMFDRVNQDFSTMTLQDLKQTKEYQTWDQAKSSLLVLQGRNGIGLEQNLHHSWLSPCALGLIDYLRSSGNSNIVAYPKCGSQIALEDVLKDIMSEVVDLGRQTL